MSGIKTTCRYCLNAVWTMSASGKQIAKGYVGRCSLSTELMSAIDRRPAPCVMVSVLPSVIRPDDKAHKCPGFVRKGPTDS